MFEAPFAEDCVKIVLQRLTATVTVTVTEPKPSVEKIRTQLTDFRIYLSSMKRLRVPIISGLNEFKSYSQV